MKKLNQTGASHIVLVLAVAVIAAVGIVGYRVVSNSEDTNSSTTISGTENHDVSVPNQFKNTADINQASKALDNTQVDSSINPSQLDQDINSVL